MGLMLSVLIFCVGVIEALAWTRYLRHTCAPCSYHQQTRSKPLWSSRRPFSKMRSNSEEYALHHEAKCVCSEVHKVDISWPRSFSLEIDTNEGRSNCTLERATENNDETISTLPAYTSSNKFPTLVKRDSNDSAGSIDELEEINFKEHPFPPLARQYSEDSWSAKKRSDSENSIESFDGFKTSKVNICWPRPFTPEDLRIIKKRNHTDSEQSVDEVEEMLGESCLKPPNVLRVINSRSPSDSESSDDGENAINNENETKDYVSECVVGDAQHDCDLEVSNIFIKPDCKLEVKTNACNVFGNCSNVTAMTEVSAFLPEIPETDADDDDVKESNNNDSPRCRVRERDRVNECECGDLQDGNNQGGSVACGSLESDLIANSGMTAIIYNDNNLLESNKIRTLEIEEEGSEQLSENVSDVASEAKVDACVSEFGSIDGFVAKVTSPEARENHGSIQYESRLQENRRDLRDEDDDSDVASSSPVSLEVNANNSDNYSLVNNYVASSRTSETLDEVSEISEKEFKELSENSNDMVNTMITGVTSVPVTETGIEETRRILTETLDNQSSLGSRDHVNSQNSEGDNLCFAKSASDGSESEESEDIDGDPGSSENYDLLSTESDCENYEIPEKEHFSVCEATECLRTDSDISSPHCRVETEPGDGSVYLCKAKESKEPDFEGSEQVRENTVILNAVVPELVEQRVDNEDVCRTGATSSDSCRQKDQNIKASEGIVEAAQSEVDKAFWLIFSGEYTKAMSKDWHSGHFCCWQCDESLTGQRYVLRDEHPYCVKCYESVFANGCEECNKIIGIDSKDLSYKDKHWHEACFLCNKCRVSLVDKQFGSKVDKIYCGNCYDQQFASRCDGCGQIFRAGTKKMEYKTRQWHEPCFCCCVCKTPIGTKSFIPREQEIYCATCYEEKFATRCVKCNKIITSGGVTYKNEPWHRECFTCTNCNTSLAGQRFTSRDEKPYCADCFGELFAKRCTACCKPITGIGGTRFISFEDRHWHNDCFICASCKTSLVGRGFITDGDDIICPDCAKQKLM